jgi:hypothetical protein
MLSACSNATPQVSLLSQIFSGNKAQTSQYVDTQIVGAKRAVTVDNYSATLVVHASGPIGTVKTSDNYQMTLRQVSF